MENVWVLAALWIAYSPLASSSRKVRCPEIQSIVCQSCFQTADFHFFASMSHSCHCGIICTPWPTAF